MRFAIAFLAAAAAAASSAGAASAANVELKDLAARVTVVPEDRSDIKVEFLSTNSSLPIQVSTMGGTTTVDGGLQHRIGGCGAKGNHPSVWVRGVGRVEAQALPQVVVRTPKDVEIASAGAVFGAIGRSAGLDLHDSGCDAWTIADVAGDAEVHESGAGAVRLGTVGRLKLHLSGAAQIHAVQARRGLEAHLSGAGGVALDEIDGPMEATISGLGHVRVARGHASLVRIALSGMGGAEFGGTAESLDASISGMGGIHVNRVTGTVTKSVSGLGRVTIDQPRS